MAIYTLFSNITNLTTSTDVATYDIGFRFSVTSSVAVYPEWSSSYYLTGVQVWRPALYTGSYTASLWYSASTGIPIATCYSITGSNASWNSWSFDTPISLSLDTEYRIAIRSYGRGWAYVTNRLVPFYSTASWWDFAVGAEEGAGAAGVFNPLRCPATGGCYHSTGSSTPARRAPPSFPSSQSGQWYGSDIIVSGSDIMYYLDRRTSGIPNTGERGSAGYLQGITMGSGMDSVYGDGADGRYYQVGVTQSLSEGYGSPPSLQLMYPGMWRFKWAVSSGMRSITVMSKQSGSVGRFTPAVQIKKNPNIGLMADISASASASTDWTMIGPISFTTTKAGSVWVEMWNRNMNDFGSSAFFDRIRTM